MTQKKPLIGIIGGKGKMGTWFRYFFENLGFRVIISDLKTRISNKELAKRVDIVIVSVPLSKTVEVIKEIRSFIRKEALLCDIASIKVKPLKAMKKTKSGALGMHPLFGPLVQNLQDQRIVFCRFRNNQWVTFLKDIFIKSGAKIIEMSPQKHDRQMAAIQALIHFLNINLARTFSKEKISFKSYFLTPVSRLQSLILGRILGQNPILYGEIEIKNPYFKKFLVVFEKNFRDLSKDVMRKDLKNFVRKFKKATFYLKDFIKVAETKSSEILRAIETYPVRFGPEKKINFRKRGLKIGYLGPKGTFSFEASQRIFSKRSVFFSFANIREVLEAVNNGEVDFGVMPVENTTSGIVFEAVNSLVEYPLKVTGSFNLRIHHCLLGRTKNKDEIKIIRTHSQAFLQSKKWLEKNLKNFSFEESLSTVAPILETNDKEIGFIGNETLSKEYNLYILAKNIEENKDNITKFYLISKKENKKLEKKLKAKRTLILFAVFDRVGILRDILDVFARNNLNLTSLHSIPSHLKPWDYFFFLEVEVFYYSSLLKKVLKEIEKYCSIIRLIGCT